MTTSQVIAVTGDVGAGKSTVSRMLESLGGVLIDADRVVGELWLSPEVIDAAVHRRGGGILDGAGRIVHAKVAALIFGDRIEYDWVCGLLHPLVKKEIKRRIDLTPAEDWVVVEIPLLFEAGVAPWVTFKIFVAATREVRLARCLSRGWDEPELARRESFFLPSAERRGKSDYVVHNNGGLDELRRTVNEIYGSVIKPGPATPGEGLQCS